MQTALASIRSTSDFLEFCERLLVHGHAVRFRAEGWSMYPTIHDGEIVDVIPVDPTQIHRGDILLCRVGRGAVAHRVVGIAAANATVTQIVLRGDASFSPDVPVDVADVLGKVSTVTRRGVERQLDTCAARILDTLVGRAWRIKRALRELLTSRTLA